MWRVGGGAEESITVLELPTTNVLRPTRRPPPPPPLPAPPVRSSRCTHRNVIIVLSPCHNKSGQAVINEDNTDTFITDISIDLKIAKVVLKEQRFRCKQGRGRRPYPWYDNVGDERIDSTKTWEDVRCSAKAWDTDEKITTN